MVGIGAKGGADVRLQLTRFIEGLKDTALSHPPDLVHPDLRSAGNAVPGLQTSAQLWHYDDPESGAQGALDAVGHLWLLVRQLSLSSAGRVDRRFVRPAVGCWAILRPGTAPPGDCAKRANPAGSDFFGLPSDNSGCRVRAPAARSRSRRAPRPSSKRRSARRLWIALTRTRRPPGQCWTIGSDDGPDLLSVDRPHCPAHFKRLSGASCRRYA